MFVTLDGEGPLHRQVYRAMRSEILSRRLGPGARLPSTRRLAATLGVSRNVAMLAYEQLLDEGYAQARTGSGTIVAPTLPEDWRATSIPAGSSRRAPASPGQPRLSRAGDRAVAVIGAVRVYRGTHPRGASYDFRAGRPSFGDFPRTVWCRLLGRRARSASRRDLDDGPPEGRRELREALAERLRRIRGVETTAQRIVIVNGSQQALDLITRILVDPGDRVLIEEPHYLGARQVFAAGGAELVPAPVDGDGMQVPKPVVRKAPRLAYVTPSHQFPTGVVLPLARRLELLDWAAASDAFIVEDDYDSEYRYTGRPLQALAGLDGHGRVIYVGTFSKLMFPALRLGYLVLPEALVEPIVAAKGLADTGSPVLEQLTLADFIREGHLDRHLHRSIARNASRRAALLEAVRDRFGARAEISDTATGLHVLVWLRDHRGQPIASLARKAEAAGVAVYPVAPFYLHPPRRSGVLLGYGPLSERQIRDGVARLAAALE